MFVVVDGVEGKGYDGIGRGLAFSPDSKRIAYITKRGNKWAVVVDGLPRPTVTGARQNMAPTRVEGRGYDGILDGSLVFSPDSTRVAYAAKRGGRWVVVVNRREGRGYDGILAGREPIFSPDSKRVAYAAKQGRKFVVVADGLAGAGYDAVGPLVFSPDSRRLAYVAERDGKGLVVVDGLESDEYDDFLPGSRLVFDGPNSLHTLAHRDGEILRVEIQIVGEAQDTPKVSSRKAPHAVQRPTLHLAQTDGKYGVVSVSFSLDGKRLESWSKDHTMRVWDVATGKEVRTLNVPGRGVWPVSFSPDGGLVAKGYSTADTSNVNIYDLATGEMVHSLKWPKHIVYSVSFSPDGKRIASSGSRPTKPGKLKIWNVETGQELLTIVGHKGPVLRVSFSPDGKFIAGGGDKTVRVWDAAGGREIRTLEGHRGYVLSVSFSPDGKRIVGGSQYTTKVWDSETGKEIHTLKGPWGRVSSVSFGPDGELIASASLDTVMLWDAETGREVHAVKGHRGTVTSVSFSPNGKCIASGGHDGAIRLWDVERGNEVAVLLSMGEEGWVAVTPDGRYDGSPEGIKQLELVRDNQALRGETFSKERHTPGLLAEVLGADRRGPPKATASRTAGGAKEISDLEADPTEEPGSPEAKWLTAPPEVGRPTTPDVGRLERVVTSTKPKRIFGLTFVGDQMWGAVLYGGGRYTILDTKARTWTARQAPASARTGGTFHTPGGMCFVNGKLWIASIFGESISCVDLQTWELVRQFKGQEEGGCAGMAYDGRHLWMLWGDLLLKKDPETGKIVGKFPAPPAKPGDGAHGLAWDGARLWHAKDQALSAIEASTGKVIRQYTIEQLKRPSGMAWDGRSLWIAEFSGTVWRLPFQSGVLSPK